MWQFKTTEMIHPHSITKNSMKHLDFLLDFIPNHIKSDCFLYIICTQIWNDTWGTRWLIHCFILCQCLMVMDLTSVKKWYESFPPSRPMPDFFMPPNGRLNLWPASSWSHQPNLQFLATLCTRPTSRTTQWRISHSGAPLARDITSSSSSKGVTQVTGRNLFLHQCRVVFHSRDDSGQHEIPPAFCCGRISLSTPSPNAPGHLLPVPKQHNL